jgi:hypothetical protein
MMTYSIGSKSKEGSQVAEDEPATLMRQNLKQFHSSCDDTAVEPETTVIDFGMS